MAGKLFNRKLLLLVTLLPGYITVAAQVFNMVVDKNGTGSFQTIQNAINAVPANSVRRTLIFVKEGIYNEKVVLAPLKGALIKIERTDIKGNYKVKTDKKGRYFHAGLPIGTYNVTCEVNGKDVDRVQGVRSRLGDPTPINFRPYAVRYNSGWF